MKKEIYLILLCLGLTSCNNNEYNYSNSKKYTAASELILNNENIETINFYWVSGDINISQSSDNSFSFKEDEQKDNLKMHYYLDDNELNIHFVKNKTLKFEYNNLEKDVNLMVPSSLQNFNINMVEGDINFTNNIEILKLDINTVDSDISFESVNIEKTKINKVDGDLNIKDFNVNKKIDLDINTVSGEDNLYIKEEIGYKLNENSLEGYYSEYGSLEYGNKYVNITYNSVDGKLSILKG